MIYVLDTNIVSEYMRPAPNQNVIWWTQDHNESIHLNTVTIYELYAGLLVMPAGKRRAERLKHVDVMVRECSDRILALDAFGSYLGAKMHAEALSNGHQVATEDCMIAAICARHDATLATRNVKDFEAFGIDIVNPFEYESETMQRLKREGAARSAE